MNYLNKFSIYILCPILFLSIILVTFNCKIIGFIFLILFCSGLVGIIRNLIRKNSNKELDNQIKIVKNKLIPFKGYAHIMLFGIIFTRYDYVSPKSIQHELIHKAQGIETGWLLMYFIYLVEGFYWFFKLLFKGNGFKKSLLDCYYHICFDQEAHIGDDIFNYKNERISYSWFEFLFNKNDDSKVCWEKILENEYKN